LIPYRGKKLLAIPGTEASNQFISQLEGTIYEKPYRFKDYPGRGRYYDSNLFPALQFLEEVSRGNVLLASDSGALTHDRAQDHMVGILLMPPTVFNVFAGRVGVFLKLRTIFSKRDPRFINFFRKNSERFMTSWDSMTATVGMLFADDRATLQSRSGWKSRYKNPPERYKPNELENAFYSLETDSLYRQGSTLDTVEDMADDLIRALKRHKIAVSLSQESRIRNLCRNLIPSILSAEEIAKSVGLYLVESGTNPAMLAPEFRP
jgi:hypothetical protein